jgi:hypothetical protein
MPNLNSDQILFVSAAFNVLTYLFMVWRKDRKQAKVQGNRDWKFKALWKEYAQKHNIPENGDE